MPSISLHIPFSINCRGKLLDCSRPLVMGILNTTPDSFYDGGQWREKDTILQKTEQLLTEGAAIIDIGGVSTRPNASEVSEDEELKRVLPVLEWILQQFPDAIISIDTFRAKVAEAALQRGASIINDISGGQLDEDLWRVVAQWQVPYLLMHLKGTPQTMQQQAHYEHLITDIADYFIQKIAALRQSGIRDIILDVGFGFGKTIAHNFQLLKQLSAFQFLNLPMLVGISRKSMIWKTLQTTPQHALNGTTALHMVALQNGANILRAHDVKAAQEAIQLWGMVR